MRRLLVLAAVLAAVVVGCSEPEPVSSAEGVAADGERVYVEQCAECHGDDLTGNEDGPSLFEAEYLLPGFDDEALWRSIRRGNADPEGEYDPMPGFPNLGRQATADVMAYIRAAQASAGG